MATRRKKASTRAKSSQRGRAKKQATPKVRQQTTGRAKSVSRKTERSKSKRSVKKPTVQKRPVKKRSQRPAKKASPKRRAAKKTVRTPKLVKRIQKSFHTLRRAALKKGKLVLPKFTRKRGKLRLRGTDGKERTLVVGDFWENLREFHWEVRVNRVFEALWREFAYRPTMYARFTFTVTRVATVLTAGSPKLIRNTKKKVQHWFFSSGVSYSLIGMRHQFQLAWDKITEEVRGSTRDNPEAAFFLEHITCIAYQVAQ